MEIAIIKMCRCERVLLNQPQSRIYIFRGRHITFVLLHNYIIGVITMAPKNSMRVSSD